MLDETNARIIVLTAPAGYGKTTLAQQWLAQRPNAWYRGTPASADVAALAVRLAVAAGEILPGAEDRLRERLRATNHPEQETDILAELLAEDLAEWPSEAWLAIDDYQFAMEAEASERFVERLLELTPLRLLVTSRNRPTWATARRILYGEIFELERDALAMSDDEAREVLAHRGEHAPALVERAEGWPAVIGLAALTKSLKLPEDDLPATLYDYFAEEVYLQAAPAVRWGFCQLAIAPTITTELAEVLKTNRTDVLPKAKKLVGLLKEREQELEKLKARLASGQTSANVGQHETVAGVRVYSQRLDGMEIKDLRTLADSLRAMEARAERVRRMGVAVFAGMLGVTFFGLFLTPVFYVVCRGLDRFMPKAMQHATLHAHGHPEPAE